MGAEASGYGGGVAGGVSRVHGEEFACVGEVGLCGGLGVGEGGAEVRGERVGALDAAVDQARQVREVGLVPSVSYSCAGAGAVLTRSEGAWRRTGTGAGVGWSAATAVANTSSAATFILVGMDHPSPGPRARLDAVYKLRQADI